MKIGVTMLATDLTIPVTELARAVEARGFASLYLPEHTHIPTSLRTPPPTPIEVLAADDPRCLAPFVALAAAAAVTDHIDLGTGVSLIAQHDPVLAAKEIATLDLVCGGRFVLGVGYGWNEEEMETHGVDPRTRRARVREHVLAMQAIWQHERASFEGEFVRFDELWSWPKPVRSPGPPVLVGGTPGPRLFADIAEWGDGWIPIGGAGVKDRLPELRRAYEAAGRDPASLRVVVFGSIPQPEKLAHFASIGVTDVVLRLPTGTRDEILPLLDEYTHFL
ncbi:MAG: TIGR03619 family F420-dependent LLM class oxidoreductase [Acidimicrobiia bacterium]|nr:TIGR03619 family F420-dependent LLM class oxidoreductase [Acidimicrobiia bacterium]